MRESDRTTSQHAFLSSEKLDRPPGTKTLEGAGEPTPAETLAAASKEERQKERLDRRAERLAEQLAHQKIAEYKRAEKTKEKEGVHQYFDGMELLFTRAVQSYGEDFDVDEQTLDTLHQIVVDGFIKQRVITDRYYAGELTQREAKKLGAQAHEEDKLLVAALLGEEGAEDFGLVVQEEGAKLKAQKVAEE